MIIEQQGNNLPTLLSCQYDREVTETNLNESCPFKYYLNIHLLEQSKKGNKEPEPASSCQEIQTGYGRRENERNLQINKCHSRVWVQPSFSFQINVLWLTSIKLALVRSMSGAITTCADLRRRCYRSEWIGCDTFCSSWHWSTSLKMRQRSILNWFVAMDMAFFLA